MMKRSISSALMGFALCAGASACCGVGPRGAAIAFGDQTNIVIWDSQNRIEHFVRDAHFTTNAEDFGFIAPTPSAPELSEANRDAFRTLSRLQPQTSPFGTFGPIAASKSAGAVQVIKEADVAGYHATTLKASDSHALADWLTANGYQSTPSIEEWTKRYIAKGWFLTAFKVQNPTGLATTGTVRMSFKTEKPFNPFFVPSDNIQPGHTGNLVVYFVSNAEYTGSIGGSEPWVDKLWSAPIPDETASILAQQLSLPPSAIPKGSLVEKFRDPEFPRTSTDDLYFSQSLDIRDLGAFAVVVVAAAFAVRALRRRGKTTMAGSNV